MKNIFTYTCTQEKCVIRRDTSTRGNGRILRIALLRRFWFSSARTVGISIIVCLTLVTTACVSFVSQGQIDTNDYDGIAGLAKENSRKALLTMPTIEAAISLNDKVSFVADCVATNTFGLLTSYRLTCTKKGKAFVLILDFTPNAPNRLSTRYSDAHAISSSNIDVSGKRANVDIVHDFVLTDSLYKNHWNELPRHIHFKDDAIESFEDSGIVIEHPFSVKLLAGIAAAVLGTVDAIASDDELVALDATSANKRFAKMTSNLLISGFGKKDDYVLRLTIPPAYIKAWTIAVQNASIAE